MDASGSLSTRLPLDRVTALSMDPGTLVGLSGRAITSVDGSSFDASSLFDFAAGGLRVVEQDAAGPTYLLAPTGQVAPGCAIVGGVPCLVPRLETLAHDRLHTASELASTLSGGIELESHPKAGAAPAIFGAIAMAALCLAAAAALVWVASAWSRRAARTALGRIRSAARRALRAMRGDATLAGARTQILALVERARQVDALRHSCARRLARIDRAALDRRAEACARATVPVAAAARASFTTERDVALQLESDHRSAVVELERIESVLRTAALRIGAAERVQGAVRVALRHGEILPGDPAAALVTELDLRDQSIAEADAS
jgi:hypothetical protein